MRRSEPLSVIPGVDDVQADITIACLHIFQLELSLKGDQRFLCNYPLCHPPFHLERVSCDTIPPQKTGKIIDGLYWLFGTINGTRTWLSSVTNYDGFHSSKAEVWRLWVAAGKYLKLVQSWLRSVESFRQYTTCDDKAVGWMLTAAKSLKNFLQPAIRTASAMWLCRPNFQSGTHFDKGGFPAG